MNYNILLLIILCLIMLIILLQLLKYNMEHLTNITSEQPLINSEIITPPLTYPVQNLFPQPDNSIPINEVYFTYGPTLVNEFKMNKNVTNPPYTPN